MSTRKIKAALSKKGIPFIKVECLRSNGNSTITEWFIEVTEGTKRDLIAAAKGSLNEDDFRYPGGDLENVIEWVDCLPSLKGNANV